MTFREVRAFKGTLPQRITAYHRLLDALRGKKVRWRCPQRFSLDPILVAGTAAQVNILARGAIIVAAMTASHVINRLSGEGFRGKTGPGDDDLAVFILISGVCGLKTSHFSKGTAC
jgi:hypothetical protein